MEIVPGDMCQGLNLERVVNIIIIWEFFCQKRIKHKKPVNVNYEQHLTRNFSLEAKENLSL